MKNGQIESMISGKNPLSFNYTCKFSKTKGFGTTVSGYNYASEVFELGEWGMGTEEELKAAVANVGVISVILDINKSFGSYKSGIFDDSTCNKDFDRQDIPHNLHAVTVVGYGTTASGQDYWILRNSWSVGWGEQGYMRMARNKNICGIANYGLYPLL
jgi:C1A family cysteine protease